MSQVEIGTISNPLLFTGVVAGQPFSYPLNPVYMWNDKGGLSKSVDAAKITVTVLELNVVDELLGYSTGIASQTFTIAYPPVQQITDTTPLFIKVNGVIWAIVPSFVGYGNLDQVLMFDFPTGTVTFGDGITGKIPAVGSVIEATYTPNRVDFGAEIEQFKWLGIKSNGVVNNSVTVLLEREGSIDSLHVAVAHVPIVSVSGAWLNSDPNRLGINYYTGGSFDTATGILTLGTSLPSVNEVILIDYLYTINDDMEAFYTQIGGSTQHTFRNPIPSNNAKLIYFILNPPATTSPSGLMNLQFRLLITYTA